MNVIFSDLDGTLLDSQSYTYQNAKNALRVLSRKKIPLVFCTSKTRAEVEFWNRKLGNHHPFITENGGGVFVPVGYFPWRVAPSAGRDAYKVIEFGAPRSELIKALEDAGRQTGCRIRAFYRMTPLEIAAMSGLPLKQARLAAQREYSEPFDILAGDHSPFLKAIEERGMQWTRGGRFYHISGGNNKGVAVRWLTEMYRKALGSVITAGLGDAPNDIDFLNAVNIPVVVRSAFAMAVHRAAPGSLVTSGRGAAGWNEAVLEIVSA